jgi:hypothetical protein
VWCHVRFHAGDQREKLRNRNLEAPEINLEQPIKNENMASEQQVRGIGVTLKCYTSTSLLAGHEVYCADLHARASNESDS